MFEDKTLTQKELWYALEPKLFGIGTESFVVGSLEFYLSYALLNKKLLCLDMGHFHPTELVSDKISSILTFSDELLLHVSRGVRWDSDHVVAYNEELQSVFNEINRAEAFSKVNIAFDFFDASINRIGAWVIGARNTLKAILVSLLEPVELLRKVEREGDWAGRLGYLEELKSLPFGAVWDRYCEMNGVPVRDKWISEMRVYEKDVLSRR
ncbi:MAG TPA: L-rhamnose isomerase [Candidatus Borkfalkia excrementipullorum]|nr:L-rhamnose isomerase [Candidatus Borkfalkia excrementipullorum]